MITHPFCFYAHWLLQVLSMASPHSPGSIVQLFYLWQKHNKSCADSDIGFGVITLRSGVGELRFSGIEGACKIYLFAQSPRSGGAEGTFIWVMWLGHRDLKHRPVFFVLRRKKKCFLLQGKLIRYFCSQNLKILILATCNYFFFYPDVCLSGGILGKGSSFLSSLLLCIWWVNL